MSRRLCMALLLCAPLAGCAAAPRFDRLGGPATGVPIEHGPWVFAGSDSARKVITPHYIIYTTVQSDEIVDRIGQLMEGGFAEYQQLIPGLKLSENPLACYVFDTRRQWAQFTKLRAGDDA